MKVYVGNLPYSTTEDDLKTMFSPHGEVASATIVTDRQTGRSRGFGFVEMDNDDGAHKAIEALDKKEMDGRTLVVNEARPREERSGGGGGGGRGPGRSGGGRFGGGGGRGGGGGGGGRGGRGDYGGGNRY